MRALNARGADYSGGVHYVERAASSCYNLGDDLGGDDHLSALRDRDARKDADGCMPVLLSVRGLRGNAAPEARGLLRVLLLLQQTLPAKAALLGSSRNSRQASLDFGWPAA